MSRGDIAAPPSPTLRGAAQRHADLFIPPPLPPRNIYLSPKYLFRPLNIANRRDENQNQTALWSPCRPAGGRRVVAAVGGGRRGEDEEGTKQLRGEDEEGMKQLRL